LTIHDLGAVPKNKLLVALENWTAAAVEEESALWSGMLDGSQFMLGTKRGREGCSDGIGR
jgi:hypothetical protein